MSGVEVFREDTGAFDVFGGGQNERVREDDSGDDDIGADEGLGHSVPSNRKP